MNWRNHIPSLIITLLLINFVSYNQNQINVQGWGLLTHQFLVESADDLITSEWQEAFDYYLPELLSGCTYPDQVLQDWDNHLYYPVGGDHNAPWKVNDTINEIRVQAEAEEWGNVFFFMGILAHYASDINIPIHTYLYWAGHSAYEGDISNHLNDFTILPENYSSIVDPVQFIIDCATYAYAYYWDVYYAYPTGDEYDVVLTNSTIKSLTEDQLGRAIGAIVAVWEYALDSFIPPEIQIVEDVAKVVIDRYHNNDYVRDGTLSAFTSTLERDICEVVFNDEEITALSLVGVDLLIITQPMEGTNLTLAEVNAINNWYQTGGKLIISGKTDFYDTSYLAIEEICEVLETKIRINDDSVYTNQNDPEYFQDWYCSTDEYGTDSVATEITDILTRKIQFYSPCSLYSTTSSSDVHWLIYGEEMFYQADRNPPAPEVIHDDSNNNQGGTSIPLAGIEITSTSAIAIFAATIWSDYDFGLSNRDNTYFIWNVIEYLLDIDLDANDDYTPATPTTPTTPTDTDTTPFPVVSLFIILVGLVVSRIIKRRKANKSV
ncbi:MAG: zinc dependent phospholipase C family protein [Candidatus Heimdallarchaeaceae archaeon]|jgi:hypothetical protein